MSNETNETNETNPEAISKVEVAAKTKKENKPFSVDPEQVEEKRVVAPSLKRIIAFSVDYLIIVVLARSIYPLFLPEHWDLLPEEGLNQATIMMISLGAILFFLKDISFGKSIGKSFLNLYVARVTEGFPPASIAQNIIRNLFLLILPVEAVKMVFDKYIRRYGDHFAGTTVIEIKRPPVVRRFTIKVVGGMLVVTTLWSITVNFQPLQIEKSYSYQIAREAVISDSVIRQAVGEIQEIGYGTEVEQKQALTIYTLTITGSNGERKAKAVVSREGNKMDVIKVTLLAAQTKSSENVLEEE